MNIKLSSLLNKFDEPATLKMAKLGRELKAQGFQITDLSLGEPDFDTPNHIKEAAKLALDQNFTHYTPVAGFLDLREAIVQKFKRENHLEYKASEVMVSTGAKQCIANLVMALVEAGDEVIIPAPFWVTYSEIVRMAGGTVRIIKTGVETGFKINAAQLRAALNDKTKLFMFSSPCNPSGALYTQAELEQLANVFAEYPNVCIMSDEIYEHINFTGQHFSIAQIPHLKSRVIVINGLSKAYAMTGWRLGYMAGPENVIKACDKIQGQITSGTNAIAQRAAITALNGSLKPTLEMVEAFKKRRDRIVELLQIIPGVICTAPPAAFYVFPDVRSYFGKQTPAGELINNSGDLCMYFLNTGHVSVVPGTSFGNDDCIRISFANSIENIEKGMTKIKDALLALK